MLIVLIIGGALLWSLTRVTEGEAQVSEIQAQAGQVLEENARADGEASDLIDRIETCTREFFDARTVDEMVRHIRHPERVRPLMEHYYSSRPIPKNSLVRINNLQPLTLDHRGNFWMQALELMDRENRNALVEVGDDGVVRIDWETLVCYQPMEWDVFALERPTSQSLEFRVYLRQDSFFSHEFADSSRWLCFRLTALDSEETLFGYVRRGDALELQLTELLKGTRGQNTSVILRLSVPEGLQSRRGVVIEKLISPRWIHLDPPASEL